MHVISGIHSSYYEISVKRMAVNILLGKPFFLFWLCCCLFSFLSFSLSVPLLSFPFSTLTIYPPSLWGVPFLSSGTRTNACGHVGPWGQTRLFLLQAPAPAQPDQPLPEDGGAGLRDRLPLPVSASFLLRSQAGIYLIAFSREGTGERWQMAFIISIKAEMKGKGISN